MEISRKFKSYLKNWKIELKGMKWNQIFIKINFNLNKNKLQINNQNKLQTSIKEI